MTNYARLPRIDPADAETVFEPPERGEGHWVGAPSVHRHDGTTYLAVRWRDPDRRGHAIVVYERRGGDESERHPDTSDPSASHEFERRFELTADELGVNSVERPCLVTDPRSGALELYFPVDWGENEWTLQKLADASRPESFDPDTATTILSPLAGTTDCETVKDPYVVTVGHRYFMYYAGHDGETEQAHLATSTDGETWERSSENPVIARDGWHDFHTRVSCVVPARDCPAWHVLYDGSGTDDFGRVWNLRTGTGVSSDLETVFDATPDEPWLQARAEESDSAATEFVTCRYVDALDRGEQLELFFEAARSDGSFELRRALVPY